VLAALFVYPLALSLGSSVTGDTGRLSADNFVKVFELYLGDIVFSGVVACATVALTDIMAVAIAGYLTLGQNRIAVAWLRWLYRWPLFIPFVVAARSVSWNRPTPSGFSTGGASSSPSSGNSSPSSP
jgi:hypothetical protein